MNKQLPILLALISAALFGSATPASKVLLNSFAPIQLAGLLYLGAAIGVMPLILKKKEIKPWLVEQWCIPTVDAEFVFRMEDVLDVYAQSSDKNRPIICFDERPTQLLSDNKIPIPPKVGRKKRIDYEYERMGNCNLFIFLEPRIGWRHIEVTDRRTSIDFAHCMKDLVDIYYPEADLIKVVMDNLNTHSPASLYKAFEYSFKTFRNILYREYLKK